VQKIVRRLVQPSKTRMTFSRVHTSFKAADVAKLLLLNKQRRLMYNAASYAEYTAVPSPNRNDNPILTLT